MSRNRTGGPHDDALDLYRAAAHAETDAVFDERALEAQRLRIMERLTHLGQCAKVIPFPAAFRADVRTPGVNRRWITAAAAAGLIIGLLGGQLVHIFPPSPRRTSPMATSIAPSAVRSGIVPAIAYTPDDGFLDEIDYALETRSAAELRALDEFTPFLEPK